MMITLAEITAAHSAQLADVLSHDARLGAALGSAPRPVTADEFLSGNAAWSEKHHACMYGILLNGRAIGTISLSHIDEGSRCADVGYWLASEHWGRGYGTQVFALLIKLARERGISRLSCRIRKDNPASAAIWRRCGAALDDLGDKWSVLLNLP